MLRALNPKKFSLVLIALFTCLFVYLNVYTLVAIPLAKHGQNQYAGFFCEHFSTASSDVFQRLEFDWSTRWQKARSPNPAVAILDIDEKSLAELGQFPFPRSFYARLLEKLKEQGVAVVAFDFLFAESDRVGNQDIVAWLERNRKQLGLREELFTRMHKELLVVSSDEQFGLTINRVQFPITLGYAFEGDANFTSGMAKKILNSMAYGNLVSHNQIEASGIPLSDFAVMDYGDYPVLPNDTIVSPNMNNSLFRLGAFNAVPDPDSVLRKARLVTMGTQNGNIYPSLAVQALSQYWRSDWKLDKKRELFLHNSLGKKVPVDPFGEIFLRYYGGSKTIPTYSFYDAYVGNLGDRLKGKIVFIGTSAIGLKDLRSNPFASAYPGVELHGTLASNILNQEFVELGLAYYIWTFVSLIGLGLLVAFAANRLHPIFAGICFVAISLAILLLSQLSFHRGIMLPSILPCLEFLCLTIAGVLFRYLQEEGEKKYIREAFSRYVSGSVVAELMRDRSKLRLGGQKRELTVLFCDLKGFTTFSESLDASLLSQLLNEFFTSMTSLVLEHRGTLDKYMGDALMCFWGAPIMMDNHAEEACATALKMCAAADHIRQAWAEKYGFEVDIRIGVNTGVMSVGNMGSEQVFSYTTLGDQVNLGSRLEGVNNFYGTRILVGEITYLQAKEKFCFRKVDTVLVKGKDIPVPVYELLDLAENKLKYKPLLDQFEAAHQTYASGRWQEAKRLFSEHIQAFPGDAPAKALLARMAEFNFEAPKEFHGVWTLGSK